MNAIEKQVAAEVAMLKDIITGMSFDLNMMIDTDQDHEEIEAMRGDIAEYKAELAKFN